MAIDFDARRWEQLRQTYKAWWAGELDRPLMPVELHGRDPGRPQPATPLLTQATCTDLTVPAEAVADRIDWELSQRVYLGDAYPYWSMDCFGPGVVAAIMGARLDNSTGRVWFHPPKEMPITELHLEYDPDNVWLRRLKELCAAMMKRWQGQVLVGMTDLGGSLDLISSFRPSEGLLLDLYDHPADVQRVLGEAHAIWHRVYAEINAILQPQNPGYSAWCSIYSDRPYYILQCDFCYMIGPEMFRQFVLPELDATTRRLERSFYHLDGKGQLPHLDAVLSLDHLHGVQWVPGAGAPGCEHWPAIYERILGAGKKTQLWGDFADIYGLLQQTGVGPGVHYRASGGTLDQANRIRGWLDRFASAGFARTASACQKKS
ncbi:MAG: hypothetical protein WCI73_04800 [Phycisphaerae bacterium]